MKKMKNTSFLFAVCTMICAVSSCKKDSNDPPAIVIGQSYNGGIVFYVDGSGKHGLVAATSDQESGVWQHCGGSSCGTLISGANGTDVGTGAQNTLDIVNSYGSDPYMYMAATICDRLNFAGYDNWFLPSKDELNLMYQYKDKIGGGNLSLGEYWSSTQSSDKKAYVQDFEDGRSIPSNKENHTSVRAVRAF